MTGNKQLLNDLVIQSCAQYPDHIAVVAADGVMTYSELNEVATRLSHFLQAAGIQRGDRVALYLAKSTRTIALMQAILRLGAIYVPIDITSPASRAMKIIKDCQVSLIATTQISREQLRLEKCSNKFFLVDEDIEVTDLPENVVGSWSSLSRCSSTPISLAYSVDANDIAYILYTSGSTGDPKGVCLTHTNALAFIQWAAKTTHAAPNDRLANHASLNFDISVLDVYVAFYVGARVCLIPETEMFSAPALRSFIETHEISIWYSVPSAIMMMMDQTDWLDQPHPQLHTILFAGEVFPLPHLTRLRNRWKEKRLMNLYGPTETNVCTYFEVNQISSDWMSGAPIGKVCCGNKAMIINEQGEDITDSALQEVEGELVIQGPTVMKQYWGKPEVDNHCYATGDMVRRLPSGDFMFKERKDSMVKLGGYRVELGEIEAVLSTHPSIQESFVYIEGSGISNKLVAVIVCDYVCDSAGKPTYAISLIALKQYCAHRLPKYMLPAKIKYVDELPRTPNGKIDRKAFLNSSTMNLSKHQQEVAYDA